MLDVSPVLAIENLHRARAIRMRAQIFQRRRPSARTETLGLFRRKHIHRAIDADGENFLC